MIIALRSRRKQKAATPKAVGRTAARKGRTRHRSVVWASATLVVACVVGSGGVLTADGAPGNLTPNYIYTVAGENGIRGFVDNVVATNALFYNPSGVAATADGGYLVADSGNNVIRRVSPRSGHDGRRSCCRRQGMPGPSGDVRRWP